jgi:endoglucanase
MLARLAELGFRTVRFPVDPRLLASGAPDRAAVLQTTVDAIARLNAMGYSVILDMHPTGTLQGALEADGDGWDTVNEAWQALSRIVADTAPATVFAELLNEPAMVPAQWARLRDRLAETVRLNCPAHALIWGPARVQGIWELNDTPILADDNALVAVHYYTPMGFTHQCADWDGSPLERIRDLPFPATARTGAAQDLRAKLAASGDGEAIDYLDGELEYDWTLPRIDADFARLRQWSETNNVPVVLDEFGVLDFCVDPASRQVWVRGVRSAAERNGVGWTYWEFDAGFGFVGNRTRPETIDHGMVDALLSS